MKRTIIELRTRERARLLRSPIRMTEHEAGAQVLIAEDDEVLRKLMLTAMSRRRVPVHAVGDGAEAIEQLERQRWGVLLLDLMMPRTSGFDVIAWLAQNRHHQPRAVIVVSAADRHVLRELDPTVVNAIIFKPFDVLHLAAYVKSAADLERPDRRRRRAVES